MPYYMPMEPGFDIGSDSYIDKRIVLTKAEMVTAEDDYFLPDVYFAYCPDDNQWYTFDINNDEDPETGKYRLMPTGLVNDVLVNGVSVVEDKIAKVDVIDDVKVDGASVVEDNVANISLDHKQDKLTAGQNIKIENNVISTEGLENYTSGYGINIENGVISADTTRLATLNAIPSNVSQLANDAGYITKAVLNLENYYLKQETYTQQEVNNLISSIAGGVSLEVVATLPLVGDANKIYLVRRSIDSNIYDQYVWFNNAWVRVGSTEANLDNYFTKQEVLDLVNAKQNQLTAGPGISLNNAYISVDMGQTLTTTGNSLDVKQASPNQLGVVKYDDATIKVNGNGQLYAVGGGGGGTSYVAGPNIQISGNVISATDTTYRNGNAIEIGSNNSINVLTDGETIKTNRNNELYMDAVAINTGEGINITRDGTIEIVPSEVAEAIDLSNYQEKFELGEHLYYTTVGGKKYLNAEGGSEGGGEVSFSSIKGYPTENANLASALNAKQDKLIQGPGITISAENVISATGGSGASSFGDLSGSPYDNANLANALRGKQDKIGPDNKVPVSNVDGLAPVATSGDYNDLTNKPVIPTVNNATITIKQGGATKGSFTLNQSSNKEITLDATGGTVNDGILTIAQNGTSQGTFSANQPTNATINIKTPEFSFDPNTGVLTIWNN